MREDECVHFGETCCLSMRVGGMLAGKLVYRQDSDLVGQNVGPGLLGLWPNYSCVLLALLGR